MTRTGTQVNLFAKTVLTRISYTFLCTVKTYVQSGILQGKDKITLKDILNIINTVAILTFRPPEPALIFS